MLNIIAVLLLIWLVMVIYVTIRLQKKYTKKQEKSIKKTTYLEEVVIDGKKKKIRKVKCPECGNKELSYQLSNNSAVTVKNKKGNIGMTFMSNSKYSTTKNAICNKCGTSFEVIKETTPSVNWIYAFFFSILYCTLGLIIAIEIILSVFLKS